MRRQGTACVFTDWLVIHRYTKIFIPLFLDGGNGINLFHHNEYPADFSDAPVYFTSYSNLVYVYFSDDDQYVSHDVKITHMESIAKPLDEKFLPSAVATKEYVDEAINTALGVIENGSY